MQVPFMPGILASSELPGHLTKIESFIFIALGLKSKQQADFKKTNGCHARKNERNSLQIGHDDLIGHSKLSSQVDVFFNLRHFGFKWQTFGRVM